jgi:hypothetical protein
LVDNPGKHSSRIRYRLRNALYTETINPISLEIVGDVVKRIAELGTEARRSHNDGNRNQRSNEAVFDSSCAGFIMDKMCNYVRHFNLPANGAREFLVKSCCERHNLIVKI